MFYSFQVIWISVDLAIKKYKVEETGLCIRIGKGVVCGKMLDGPEGFDR